MNVLELKGELLNLVSQLHDEQSLVELLEHAGQLVTSEPTPDDDHWQTLSEGERQRIVKAAQDFHEGKSSGISNEEVLGTYRKWL
jgi:hypothetical protein